MSIEIGLSKVHFPITVLGPGRRIAIWFQGCSIRCPGCMSRDTWASARTTMPVASLVGDLATWLCEADGVTISGGEPFDQPEALAALVEGLRCANVGSILVYSGYSFDILQEQRAHVLADIDVLISEPFDAERCEPALLRGSANQRVHCLTAKGTAMWRLAEEEAAARSARLDVIADLDGSLWIAGVPQPGDLDRLGNRLGLVGIRASTSAGRLGGEP